MTWTGHSHDTFWKISSIYVYVFVAIGGDILPLDTLPLVWVFVCVCAFVWMGLHDCMWLTDIYQET